MERILFLSIGNMNTRFLHRLVKTLNSMQSAFSFSIDPLPVQMPTGMTLDNGTYNEDQLQEYAASVSRNRHMLEYPILVCDLPLQEELSTCFDSDSALISINHWKRTLPNLNIDKIFAYNLVDILLTRKIVDFPEHEDEVRGCPSDVCENPNDRYVGIEKCEFCDDCRFLIRQAIDDHKLSVGEAGAIFRIFDWVASRKRAFVIMPFGKELDPIYDIIRVTLEQNSYICVRSDKLHETGQAMDLVREEIHRADKIIAVLTNLRPNVFYEIGYAECLERPLILICQNTDEAPFNLGHRKLICYQPTMAGYEQLKTDLRSTLKASPASQ